MQNNCTYTFNMDSQGNLVNGNPMALNKYIFQVMYPNKYYIFGIIEEYYDELSVPGCTKTSWTPR